jgi:hypothetical protein
MDSKSLFLTGNTSTMYAVGFLDLKKDGPTVVELPSRMLGILDDMAFLYMTDLGMAGPDRGKGGKFLVLPPDHEGDGARRLPRREVSHLRRVALHARLPGQGRRGRVPAHPRQPEGVFLARKDDPPAMEFINGSGREINTVLPNDSSFFEKIHGVVQEEPESFLGPEIKGQLAAIGIEKGKPFAPDDRMKKILIDAAAIGNAAARAISYSPRHPGLYTYGKDSGWYRPIISGDTTYTQNGARVLDGRVFYHFGYICVSPAMATKAAGKGSDYSMGMVDSKGGRSTARRPTGFACRPTSP